MFHQTWTSCKPQGRSHFTRAVCVLPSPPGSNEMVPSAAAWRYLQRVHYNAFSWVANLSLVTFTFDFWPWRSNLSERGTKHIFHVHLAQIHSVVSRGIWLTNKQTKKLKTAPKTEPYAVHSMRPRLWWWQFQHSLYTHYQLRCTHIIIT